MLPQALTQRLVLTGPTRAGERVVQPITLNDHRWMEPKEIVNVKPTVGAKENPDDETKRGQGQREMAPGRRKGPEFCREQAWSSFIGCWGCGGGLSAQLACRDVSGFILAF